MYAKIHKSLWDGTLADSWQGWALFVFLLAHADADGVVDMTPAAIVGRSGLKIEDVLVGLDELLAPDPNSRTPDFEGRRLALLDESRSWGWFIVNYKKYRDMKDMEQVREQNRERVRRWRETHGNAPKRSVTLGNAEKRQEEVEVEVEEETESQKLLVTAGDRKRVSSPKKVLNPESVEFVESFEVFWTDYPRKQKRLEAEKAWAKIPVQTEAYFHQILLGLEKWKVSKQWQDSQFIPLAATWLNNRQYDDDIPEASHVRF